MTKTQTVINRARSQVTATGARGTDAETLEHLGKPWSARSHTVYANGYREAPVTALGKAAQAVGLALELVEVGG